MTLPTTSSSGIAVRAYAKVNLTLEILGRRSDGYHDLASLVQTISLADELRVAPALDLTCTVEGMDLADEDNLVLRAARALASELGLQPRAALHIVKRVPAAAGLGGGSSDAAATLWALARVWGCRVHPSVLERLALRLGSDVPFLLRGGTGVMTGRGERVEYLRRQRPGWVVVVVPDHTVGAKTARLYGALRPSDFTNGGATRAAAQAIGNPTDGRPLVPFNGFARAARETFPGLAELWHEAERLAARPLHLSGAGPTLFALADSAPEAHGVADRVRHLGTFVQVSRFVGKGHQQRRISYP